MVRLEQGLTVSPASAFKREPLALLLPSKRVVLVQDVDLVALITANKGDVPDFISGQVLSMFTGTKHAANTGVKADNVGEMFEFVGTIVKAAVVQPRIVETPDYDAGQIGIDDLSTDDKLHIFGVAMPAGDAAVASSFRKRVQNANLAFVRDVPDNGEQTERPAGADE